VGIQFKIVLDRHLAFVAQALLPVPPLILQKNARQGLLLWTAAALGCDESCSLTTARGPRDRAAFARPGVEAPRLRSKLRC